LPEFLSLTLPSEALQTFLEAIPDKNPLDEEVETSNSLGRVLFADLISPHPLPQFPRSTVDGYALIAHDSFGVSETMPGYLNLVGEVLMGHAPIFSISAGQCALIHTGGMLPQGADAVIMLENTQNVTMGKDNKRNNIPKENYPLKPEGLEIEIAHAIAAGENVIRIGEDVAAGQVVLKKGNRMRPAEIGGCMALGVTKIRVARKPKIGIIATGDEVISPANNPSLGQVRDVNSYTLAALIEKTGGEPEPYGIAPDRLELIKSVAEKSIKECDAVIITAGSSASSRDMTAEVINSLGAPGILVHGVNIRPGKPTILGICGGKPVIGLPGNPVSALVIAYLFVVPVIWKLLGITSVHPYPSLKAIISVNFPSQAGREEWVPVKLVTKSQHYLQTGKVAYVAEPVFGKSNLIFSLASADGFVRISPESTGISAGEEVEVMLIE
jgi:molybdopterin molybdotransferase